MAEFSLTYPVASDMGQGHNADRETETSLRTLLLMKTHRYPPPSFAQSRTYEDKELKDLLTY